MKVLGSKQGMFGPVWVADDQGERRLMIGMQVQGGCYLQDGKPTTVASSRYLSGWLIAGTQNPDASAVMVGLGSGAGPVALLSNFPQMDLTVVEIDPVIVEMAVKHFPLLDKYQDEGRLRIIENDATKFLEKALSDDDHWDVGFADAYQGSNSIHLPEQQIRGLAGTCKHVWFNYIGIPGNGRFKALTGLMRDLKLPLTALFDDRPDNDVSEPRNLILTTQTIEPEKADEFEPYEESDDPHALDARERYREMLSSEQPL